MKNNFIEKRMFYRLPFEETLLMTDGSQTVVGTALNISRGGLFLKSLKPLPLDSRGHVTFLLPGHPKSLCIKAKVAHLVFDRQRAEVDCGMGLQFVEIDSSHQALIDSFIDKEKEAYLSLQRVLKERRPMVSEIEKHFKQLPELQGLELSSLRYKVNRICTIFEADPALKVGGAGGKS